MLPAPSWVMCCAREREHLKQLELGGWEPGKRGESGADHRPLAACTHMGCIVQWQNSDHKFHCPCHGGLFTASGEADAASSKLYLQPLPQLETKIDQGKVYVRVPTRS